MNVKLFALHVHINKLFLGRCLLSRSDQTHLSSSRNARAFAERKARRKMHFYIHRNDHSYCVCALQRDRHSIEKTERVQFFYLFQFNQSIVVSFSVLSTYNCKRSSFCCVSSMDVSSTAHNPVSPSFNILFLINLLNCNCTLISSLDVHINS